MCGRFYIENDIEDIIKFYGVRQVNNRLPLKGEIWPGTNIPVILNNKVRVLDYFRWGFQLKSLNREVINARIETVGEKKAFNRAFQNNRCIIPASAFFEWETLEKTKLKYKISVKNMHLFSMAGIYERFIDKNDTEYYGVVILTRPANRDMEKLHHRMPVFILKEDEDTWLSKDNWKLSSLKKQLAEETPVRLEITPAEGTRQVSIYDLM